MIGSIATKYSTKLIKKFTVKNTISNPNADGTVTTEHKPFFPDLCHLFNLGAVERIMGPIIL